MRFANGGAHHTIGTVDHPLTPAMQLKENQRRFRLCCTRSNCLVGSPIDHGPIHRDTSCTQFITPFFIAFLAKFEGYLRLCSINGVYELKTRSHSGGKVAGKTENIARSLEQAGSAENALNRSSLAIAEQCLRTQNEYRTAGGSKQVLGG